MAKKSPTQALEAHGLTKEQSLELLRQMWEIRFFEDRVYDLLGRNIIKGASHLYAGQEAVATGAISVLRDDDLITSTHRGHGHCHARGAAIAKTEEAKQEHYDKMMAELENAAPQLLTHLPCSARAALVQLCGRRLFPRRLATGCVHLVHPHDSNRFFAELGQSRCSQSGASQQT